MVLGLALCILLIALQIFGPAIDLSSSGQKREGEGEVELAGISGDDHRRGSNSKNIQELSRERTDGGPCAPQTERTPPVVSKAKAFVCFTLGRSSVIGVADNGGSSELMGGSSRRGRGFPGLLRSSSQEGGSGGGCSDPEQRQGAGNEQTNAGGGLRCQHARGKGGRSTLVLCVAGCICNITASITWALLLSWARDVLLIPGMLVAGYTIVVS